MATTKKAPFTKGEINLMVKYHLDGYNVHDPMKYGTAVNPCSGVEVKLNQFEAELYIAAMKLYRIYEMGDFSAVRDFDRLKYLLLKVNPEAYYDLID